MTDTTPAPIGADAPSLRAAAILAFNALHECIVPKGAEAQISDAMRALRSAIDATTIARAEPAGQPGAAYADPYGWDCAGTLVRTRNTMESYRADGVVPIPLFADSGASRGQAPAPAAVAEPVAWLPVPAAQGDALPREDFAWMVVQAACETEPADEDDPECIRILRRDLKSAVLAALLRHGADAARTTKEGGAT